MILFDLKCLDGGEVFEAWFRSSGEYEEQSARGLVQCPLCQSSRVEKAPMAPRVPRKAAETPNPAAAMAQLSALQQRLLAGSEWVGDALPEKARAMHFGELEQRPVHGRATAEEARSLAEEGVPMLPLPLPIVPPGQLN